MDSSVNRFSGEQMILASAASMIFVMFCAVSSKPRRRRRPRYPRRRAALAGPSDPQLRARLAGALLFGRRRRAD